MKLFVDVLNKHIKEVTAPNINEALENLYQKS